MPAENPATAPEFGPSSMASTIVTRYMSSGLAPASLIWAKTVDWSSRAVTTIAAHASVRRTRPV
jgi:hypothetical protein